MTGCYSLPFDVTVDPIVGQLPTVTTISYTTPVCQGTTSPQELPNTSATGFTSGGTYSELTTTGLIIDPTTGLIDLVNSTAGLHTVQYEVLFDSTTCQSYGVSTFDVTITPVTTANVICTYPVSVCKIAEPSTITPLYGAGFTNGGTFSATPAGLSIDPSSGVINLATSTPNAANTSYTITYTVNSVPGSCFVGAVGTYSIAILPATIPGVSFSYNTPICPSDVILSPSFGTGFTSGGIYSTNDSISVDGDTGNVTISSATLPGTYTINYSVGQVPSICQDANSGSASITISSPVQIGAVGDCQGMYFVLTVSPVTGTFDATATFVWTTSSGEVVGNTQSINALTADTYTVTVTVNGCSSVQHIEVTSADLACVIQKGISVNADGKNDVFDLSGFNVKKITIFNRYGMEVYSKSNYTNEWGGESNKGDKLPDGTYYYVFERANGETRTGWIYINREQ